MILMLLFVFAFLAIGIIASFLGVQSDAGFTTLFVLFVAAIVIFLLAKIGFFNKDK